MAKKDRIRKKHDDGILHGLAGSLEEAFSEDTSEIQQDDVIIVDVPERSGKNRGKRVLFFIAGVTIIVFAILGIISTVITVSQGISDIANQTAFKNDLTRYLYPIVATDPPSFDKTENLTSPTIIKAAISRIRLTGDMSKYHREDGMVYIPEFDVETNAKNIFGGSVTFEHRTVGHVTDLATYIPDKKVYAVEDMQFIPNYSLKISELQNVGETYTVTVDYFPPSIDIPGLDREPESIKTMIYTIVMSGDKKTITSLKIAESSGPLYEDSEKN
mgnify:CR=1 FL=1